LLGFCLCCRSVNAMRRIGYKSTSKVRVSSIVSSKQARAILIVVFAHPTYLCNPFGKTAVYPTSVSSGCLTNHTAKNPKKQQAD